jgi:hypothetical protein
MAYNSGGANPIGVKTGPRPEDAYVPPVDKETLNSIESKADANTDKGTTKREGVVRMRFSKVGTDGQVNKDRTTTRSCRGKWPPIMKRQIN